MTNDKAVNAQAKADELTAAESLHLDGEISEAELVAEKERIERKYPEPEAEVEDRLYDDTPKRIQDVYHGKSKSMSEDGEDDEKACDESLPDFELPPVVIGIDPVRQSSFITALAALAASYGFALDAAQVVPDLSSELLVQFTDADPDVTLPKLSVSYDGNKLDSFYFSYRS